jgi:seryl-tRNA synthetase
MGYDASHAQWDPEAWLPSQQEFMELGTSTNTTDYQARRLKIYFKDSDGNKKLVHTVNDTGMTTRTLIAIIDNYQQADGSIKVPEVLQKYIGKEYIKENT